MGSRVREDGVRESAHVSFSQLGHGAIGVEAVCYSPSQQILLDKVLAVDMLRLQRLEGST